MDNKKKKIIIAVIVAVIIIAAAVAVYFVMNKDDNGYTDVPVTEIVTDENGETVTNANGQAVTEAVTDSSGKPQTTRKQQNGGGNQDTTANNNNQGDNSGSGSGSGSDSQQTTEKLEDKKPKNRKITVTAVLPMGCGLDDVMEIWVNGEKDSEIVVGEYLEGNSIVVAETAESYKDDVSVELILRNYKTNVTGTVLNNHEEIKLDFPLNKVEDFTGEDD